MNIKKFISLLLCFVFLLSFCACDKGKSEFSSKSNGKSAYIEKGSYSEYVSELEFSNLPTKSVNIIDSETEVKNNTYSISVSENGIYQLAVEYMCASNKDVSVCFEIDGKTPFDDCERLKFPAVFCDENSGFKTLENGDEAPFEQVLYNKFIKVYAKDYLGKTEGRYCFYLSKGKHSVSFKTLSGEFLVKDAEFVPFTELKKYSKPANMKKTDEIIEIETEKSSYKNSKSLLPLSGTESVLHPIDASVRKLNYIGGDNWSDANITIYWDMEVKESGYYSVCFDYRQNLIIGGNSYRILEIDGEPPFYEANRVPFEYCSGFKSYTFGNEKNEPYYFYLEKGKHTLSLSATPGPFAEIYYDLKNLTSDMSSLYLDMTMIIGETVDPNRSYELFNKIPDFNNRLQKMIDSMNMIIEKLSKNQKSKSNTNISSFQNAIRVLKQMIDNPYTSHLYKGNFYDCYTDLSALMGTITSSTLDLDRIVLKGYNSSKKAEYSTYLQKLAYNFKRVVLSYASGYSHTEKEIVKNNSELELWINWGRDQANVITTMIQDDFIPKTGIGVNVSIANATIVQAILSGKGPDVLLQLARTDPVNYAMRGALINLDEFDDYGEVIKRFSKDAVLPYVYNGKVYALPDTQSFFVMFVRDDICNSLKIKIPNTWDEYIDTAMQLQRKNLGAYIPYTRIADGGASNSGVGGMSIYPTLLLQNNLRIYEKDKSKSLLSGTQQVKVFSYLTDLYTKYKFPVQADFYNRFRVGTMPIGISTYITYTTLMDAAPEIEGKWHMTYLPGTLNKDGTVNRTVAGSGSGCSITRLTRNKEKAWEFLKWWTSADTQVKYSNKLESVLGTLGRVATSNIEAVSRLDYDENTKNLILDVLNNHLAEIEEVPGGYYTARGIDQAFWATVEQNKMPIDSLVKWAKSVDDEIERKTAEYAN